MLLLIQRGFSGQAEFLQSHHLGGVMQSEAGGARGSAWSRVGDLFLALLHLSLDPAACLLSLDLQVLSPLIYSALSA